MVGSAKSGHSIFAPSWSESAYIQGVWENLGAKMGRPVWMEEHRYSKRQGETTPAWTPEITHESPKSTYRTNILQNDVWGPV